MQANVINIKDKVFLVLFLIGWSTISYSVFKINELKHIENSINVNLEIKPSLNYKTY
jgi:hypothetical protein